MTDINRFLKSLPAGVVSEDAKEEIREIYESLTDVFTTERTRVTDLVYNREERCVSIILTTPYLIADNSSSGLFSDILRVSDAIAITPVHTDDGFVASIVFTIAS